MIKLIINETEEQLQQIMELLPETYTSQYEKSIDAWLEGRYLPNAYDEWKDRTRYEQAEKYIKWLKEERYENS